MKIGVLALQGDFQRHLSRLGEIGVKGIAVRKPEALKDCQGLIIPGGESTTLVKLMKNIGLFEAIPEFNRRWPVFGTCAGAILVSREVNNHPVEPLGLMDIAVQRNAYGRQIDSFVEDVTVNLAGAPQRIEAVFIRAPRITRVGEGVEVLSRRNGDLIFVESERVLAATFHPELTANPLVHQYFVAKVRKTL